MIVHRFITKPFRKKKKKKKKKKEKRKRKGKISKHTRNPLDLTNLLMHSHVA